MRTGSWLSVVMAALLSAGGARGQSPALPAEAPPHDSALAAIEQRLRIVERQRELEQVAAAAAPDATSSVTMGPDGLQVRSADGGYLLRIRGYLHGDSRYFFEGTTPQATTFQMRRVRPILEGTVARYYHFRLMPDFGGGTVSLQDAYVEVGSGTSLRARFGKFKPPVGLERLQSATGIPFVERGLPTALVPNRDVGIQLHGDLPGGLAAYQFGLFNGVADGGSGDVDVDAHKDLAGRIFFQPFRAAGPPPLRGLGFGVAATRGRQEGSTSAPGLPSYRTVGQQPFFAYRANGTADGTALAAGRRTRLSPQGSFYLGPFSLVAEHVSSVQRVSRGAQTAQLTHRAWQAAGSWVITGEAASPSRVRPRAGGRDAVELVSRIGALRMDDDAFPFFADPERAAREARSWGVGLNWSLNRNVRLSADYDRTAFRPAPDGPARDPEQGILTRIQLSF